MPSGLAGMLTVVLVAFGIMGPVFCLTWWLFDPKSSARMLAVSQAVVSIVLIVVLVAIKK